MERRTFLTNIGQVSVLMCAGSIIASCSKSSATPANNGGNNNGNNGGNNNSFLIMADLTTELLSIGSAKINSGGDIIVIRTATGNVSASFIALTLICTHMGCTVNYDSSSESFKCPCHGSEYNIKGQVTQGPAPSPLKTYSVTITNDQLTVS
ncbi:MAG TPA: Rieske 2Fe-2S domain-containing protein [Puia sp.]|nr:Rieske 2Fe-2S domain-containing protein [Puia sp.]